jgi:anti-sigma-K factor RskA
MNELDKVERIKLLAAGFVIDDLEPDEDAEFRQLLKKHPESVKEIDDLQEVFSLLLDEFTPVETPTNLLPNILKQIETENINQKKIVKLKPKWQNIIMGVATLIIVILGIDNYRLRFNFGILTAENNRLNQEMSQVQIVNNLLEESNLKLLTFESQKMTSDVSATILINPAEKKAMISVKNLPAPPEGSYYLLSVKVADQMSPCVKLKPDNWGDSMSKFSLTEEIVTYFDNPKFSGLYITLENDKNLKSPTGPILMQTSEI